jgi:uncharacterized 2Fe-2S/4Fe-4S cluster protein (DUF4445 family)
VRFTDEAPQPLPVEKDMLSAGALAAGWRLACRRQVSDENMPALELPPSAPDCVPDGQGQPGDKTAKGTPLLLAVDLGTTSVQWRALAACGPDRGMKTAEGGFLNPQAGAGADVVSRLALAAGVQGRTLLSNLVRASLSELVARLGRTGPVKRLCLAANTAMTDIFLNRDISGLAAAPYHTGHAGHETALLPGLPPVYIPPLPAPFVGGDASAALLAMLKAATQRPFILADLGTNAEIILVTGQGNVFMTSVPLGPALEGIGMECGCLAGPQAATGFLLTPSGLSVRKPEGGALRGVSATGYISLLAQLRRCGVLDENGHFVKDSAMPLAQKIAATLERERGRLRLPLPGGLWLSARDVEEVLKVKAAFSLALEKLLEAGGLPGRELARICLAGALGEHVVHEDLLSLGFVPRGPRVLTVGNAALDGAALLALEPQKGPALAGICRKATQVQLAQDAVFQRQYLKSMIFPECG